MTTGIYKLTFSNGSFYIGQSIKIEKRYKDHLASLKNGTCSKKMYKAFKESGLPSLSILDICDIEELDLIEEDLIREFKATEYPGLNTCDKPEGTSCGQYAPRAKYDNDTYVRIMFKLLDQSITFNMIADELEVSEGVVRSIRSGDSHTWLSQSYPEEYSKMIIMDRKNTGTLPKEYPYALLDPQGNIHNLSGLNVSEFARNHQLEKGCVSRLLKGQRKSHKGWTLCLQPLSQSF